MSKRDDSYRYSRRERYLFGILVLLIVTWFFAIPLVQRMIIRFERTAFEQVVRQLNAACRQLVIEAKATESSNLRDWLGENPMACLEKQALSGMAYIEQETSSFEQPKATWMFEADTGSLRYRWRHSQQLISSAPEPDIVRYRLSAEFADTNQNEILDDGEVINGLVLKSLYPFRWRSASDY